MLCFSHVSPFLAVPHLIQEFLSIFQAKVEIVKRVRQIPRRCCMYVRFDVGVVWTSDSAWMLCVFRFDVDVWFPDWYLVAHFSICIFRWSSMKLFIERIVVFEYSIFWRQILRFPSHKDPTRGNSTSTMSDIYVEVCCFLSLLQCIVCGAIQNYRETYELFTSWEVSWCLEYLKYANCFPLVVWCAPFMLKMSSSTRLVTFVRRLVCVWILAHKCWTGTSPYSLSVFSMSIFRRFSNCVGADAVEVGIYDDVWDDPR